MRKRKNITSYKTIEKLGRNLKPDIVYIVTADKKNPYFQVSISTYENKISLTSNSLISDKDHKLVINILQDIKNNLQNFYPRKYNYFLHIYFDN